MRRTLGLLPDDRAIIINADDFGILRSANMAIAELFQKGSITSASIMMPCEASIDAANRYKTLALERMFISIGVHLTLTSSPSCRYKPVFRQYQLQSLVTDEGYFPTNALNIELDASTEQVHLELEAQIQCAISAGIDVTHLDSHAGAVMGLHTGRDFLETVFDLCEAYELPFALPTRIIEQPFFSGSQKKRFQQAIDSAARRGIGGIDDLIVLPYHLDTHETYADMRNGLIRKIASCKPGITQIVAHPSFVSEELKALTPHYLKRELEYALLNDPEIKGAMEHHRIRLLSWKDIRDAQRMLKRML